MKHEGDLRLMAKAGTKEKWAEKVYNSIIARQFRRFTNWLYSLLINGFFGKFFTAYSAEETKFFNSRFYRVLGGGKQKNRETGGFRFKITRAFENSRLLMAVSNLVSSLIHRKLKTFGGFLLSLGSYGIISYVIRVYVFAQGSKDFSVLLVCFAFLLLAIPLMISHETFASATQKSTLMSVFLFKWLGIPRDSFAAEKVYPKRYTVVTVLGMLLGALTYFIHPAYYVVVALILMAITLVFTYPEIGVLGMIALVPMASFFSHPSIALFGTVCVTLVGYWIKLLRGKRVTKLNLCDFSVLVFAIILFLGGIFSAGGKTSFYSAGLYFSLMMGYFLTVNLIRTREWVRRCVATFLVFAALTSVLGLFQVFTGSMEESWLDVRAFSGINVRITATFDNPNVYAGYLLLVIPFALAMFFRKEQPVRKIPLFACLFVLVVCLIETWSRGAWLGALVMLIFFFLIYSRRSLPYLLLGGALAPMVSVLLPQNILSRFMSIGTASDSSSLYRISAWRGAMEMIGDHWLGGVGAGESAFAAVYPSYSYAGIEGIRHTHNLYLQILSESGVIGLVVFFAVVFLFLQNCFEYLYKMRNRGETVLAIAGITAICASLIMGVTDYIWYNSRLFLMFWLVMGLVNAYIRVGLSEINRSNDYETNTLYSVNFDLNIDNL